MNMRHYQSPSIILSTMLALLLQPAPAATIRSADAYQTDFDDNVAADFCGGAIMESSYNPTPGGNLNTSHATNAFLSGYARLSARYANPVYLALVAGGAQSPTLVSVGNVPNGSGGKTNIYNYASGIFSNSLTKLTYSLYTASGTINHTNLTVYVASRKNDTPADAGSIGPYPYRVPHYLAWYNGRRLSLGEWTFLPGAALREIAGADISAASSSSTFVLTLSVVGGNDAGGIAANGKPCKLSAELRENGRRLASVRGQDQSYNWSLGPEGPGSVFSASGDYNFGSWSPYAGDWDDSQSWGRGNHDIRLPGWTVFGFKPIMNIGTFQGIDVQALSVTQPPRALLATMILIR
jgi:hypothetical protein